MDEWADPRYAELVEWYRQTASASPQTDTDGDQHKKPVRAFLADPPVS